MFSSRMHRHVIIFLLLFLAGIVTANILFIYLSFPVALFVVMTLFLEGPSGISVKTDKAIASVWLEDAVTFCRTLTIANGTGIVAVADTLSSHFERVEGNNFHVFFKGMKPLEKTFSYTLRCTHRGSYHIGIGRVEAIHSSGLEQTGILDEADKVELTVRTKPSNLHRIRDPRVISQIPMPLSAKCRTGVTTSDFREIRAYSHGDSYRSINWKATARLPATPDLVPMVNDRERDGEKTVWVFLDTREWMRAGSSVENAFEYAVQAALGVSQFYLARNCKVGLSFFNNDQPILPEMGRKQTYKIARKLIEVKITGTYGKQIRLAEAVESCRGYLAGTNPFFVVITMIEPGKAEDILDGIRSMRHFGENSRTAPQIMFLQVLGYELLLNDPCDHLSAALIDLRNSGVVSSIRQAGAYVVPWNPRSSSLLKVLAIGLKRKMRGV